MIQEFDATFVLVTGEPPLRAVRQYILLHLAEGQGTKTPSPTQAAIPRVRARRP